MSTGYVTIGVSDLDTYLYGLKAGKSPEQICADILREFVPSPAILAGLAGHELIEKWHLSNLHYVGRNGEEMFYCNTQKVAVKVRRYKEVIEFINDNYRDPVHEMWIRPQNYKYSGWTISVRGKIDIYENGCIGDHKFKISPIRNDYTIQYAYSPQWQLYLMATGLDEFQYNIFYPEQWGDEDSPYIAAPPLKLYRYVGMEEWVEAKLYEFFQFLSDHNMFSRIAQFKANRKK